MISSTYNNLDFVGTPLLLRAALQVGMATMHFYIAQIGLFLGKDFLHSGGPREQFGINEKLSWGAR